MKDADQQRLSADLVVVSNILQIPLGTLCSSESEGSFHYLTSHTVHLVLLEQVMDISAHVLFHMGLLFWTKIQLLPIKPVSFHVISMFVFHLVPIPTGLSTICRCVWQRILVLNFFLPLIKHSIRFLSLSSRKWVTPLPRDCFWFIFALSDGNTKSGKTQSLLGMCVFWLPQQKFSAKFLRECPSPFIIPTGKCDTFQPH